MPTTDNIMTAVQELRDHVIQLQAENNQQQTETALLRSELEHYRLLATEARTHLNILRGHVNEACRAITHTPEATEMSVEDDTRLKRLAHQLAPEPYTGVTK